MIIVDDAHNVSDLKHPYRLERTIEQFNSYVVGRLNNPKKGRIMVVGHRVHESDLSANLLDSGGWTHLALPIIATQNQTYKTNYGRWKRRKGELLRPDAFDADDIERLKLVNPSFALLYQQNTDAQSLPSLTSKHFLTYNLVEVEKLPHFISVDPGTSDGEGRSFSVALVWASNGVDFFLVDEFRKRCDFEDLARAVRTFAKRYHGAPILIEETANGPALLSQLRRRQRRRAFAITPSGSKTTRFRRHLEKILGGRIRIPKQSAFTTNFVEELVQFPHGRHDDQVDAMTQFLDWFEKQDEIDFSKTNVSQRGVIAIARGSEYRPSPGCLTPQTENVEGRGIIVISKPQLYNPPFPEVKAWVRY
jgi:predicted phage terminase large subunit-like protein